MNRSLRSFAACFVAFTVCAACATRDPAPAPNAAGTPSIPQATAPIASAAPLAAPGAAPGGPAGAPRPPSSPPNLGPPTLGGKPCHAKKDCATGQECAYLKAGCDAPAGECVAADPSCSEMPSARQVCSCDRKIVHFGGCSVTIPYLALEQCP
jgi:hypothetical protein